jgi:hypothetical protein
MSCIHEKYVIVPADKALNNIVFTYASHITHTGTTWRGIDYSLENPLYTRTTWTKEEILDNLCSFGISTIELDLPSMDTYIV